MRKLLTLIVSVATNDGNGVSIRRIGGTDLRSVLGDNGLELNLSF